MYKSPDERSKDLIDLLLHKISVEEQMRESYTLSANKYLAEAEEKQREDTVRVELLRSHGEDVPYPNLDSELLRRVAQYRSMEAFQSGVIFGLKFALRKLTGKGEAIPLTQDTVELNQ